MRRLAIVLLLMQGYVFSSYCQVLYGESGYDLASLDFSSCTRSVEFAHNLFITGTAVCPDGNVYLMSSDEIYLADPVAGNVSSVYSINTDSLPFSAAGGVCDHMGNLYFGGNGIAQYNIYNGNFKVLGILPNGLRFGDLTFYRGKCYGLHGDGHIFDIDLQDINNSSVVNLLPFSNLLGIAAVTAVSIDCDSSIIVFTPTLPTGRDLYSYDITTNTAQFICGEGQFGDFGSDLEFIQSNCILTVDLDIDNSSKYIVGDFGDTTDCGPVELALSDEDADVFSQHGPIDSITVELIDALDGGDEYLRLSAAVVGVTARFDSPQRLTLLNDAGLARFTDFEAALKSLRYHHDRQDYTAGVRHVEFRPYSGVQIGDSSVMHIHLLSVSRADAGADTSLRWCMEQRSIDLDTLLMRSSGQWLDGQSIADLRVAGRDTFAYIVEDVSACVSRDTALVYVEVVPQPTVDLGRDTLLCDPTGYMLAATGMYDTRVWWDASTDSLIILVDFGEYSITVDNAGLCAVSDTVRISPSTERIVIDRDTSVCAGETLLIDMIVYSAGDTAMVVLPSATACDTLLRYRIDSVLVPPTLLLDTTICQGTTILINGETHSVGDTVFGVLSSAALCDTPYQLFILAHPNPPVLDITTSPSEIFIGDTIMHSISGPTDSIVSGHWDYHGLLLDSTMLSLQERVTVSGEVIWTYIDQNGCIGELRNTYEAATREFTFYIPNAFSPNNDGINDVFAPQGPDLERVTYTMAIYNRWGGQVFYSDSITGQSSWNGSSGGKTQNEGVYVWVIHFYEGEDLVGSRQGDVLLLR